MAATFAFDFSLNTHPHQPYMHLSVTSRYAEINCSIVHIVHISKEREVGASSTWKVIMFMCFPRDLQNRILHCMYDILSRFLICIQIYQGCYFVKYVAFEANLGIRKRICCRKFAYFDFHCGVRTIFYNEFVTINSS